MLRSFLKLGSISDKAEERGRHPSPRVRSAFTLVELLVVIVIIGILIALLLPAIQAAREAARKMTCSAHLSMLAKACINHESTQGNFPSGGWNCNWMGDPDCGFGPRQPGGWTFSILPFLDAKPLYDMGKGLPFAKKKDALARMAAVPHEVFICPTRRQVSAYPLQAIYASAPLPNVGAMSVSGRTDYAGNVGDLWGAGGGWYDVPTTPADPKLMPPSGIYGVKMMAYQCGVILQTYGVTSADIKDGLSNTYLLGEKLHNPDNYLNGLDGGDDNPIF